MNTYFKYSLFTLVLIIAVPSKSFCQSGTYTGPELSMSAMRLSFKTFGFDDGALSDDVTSRVNISPVLGLKFNHFLSDKFYFSGNTGFLKRSYFKDDLVSNEGETLEHRQIYLHLLSNFRWNKNWAAGIGLSISHLTNFDFNNFPPDQFPIFGDLRVTQYGLVGGFNFFHRGWNVELKSAIPVDIYQQTNQFFSSTMQSTQADSIVSNLSLELSLSYLIKWGWLKELKEREKE